MIRCIEGTISYGTLNSEGVQWSEGTTYPYILVEPKSGSPKIMGKSRKYQILCHEIEPNPSKDRFMHEGDNSSFENQ